MTCIIVKALEVSIPVYLFKRGLFKSSFVKIILPIRACKSEFCQISQYANLLGLEIVSSVESQKGVNAVQDVPLRTRRALSLYKFYGDSALLVLNGASLNNVNALLALSR